MGENITIYKRTPLAPLQYQSIPLPKKQSLCLTPLEVKEVRQKRAREFGLSPAPRDPFLLNQSFPAGVPHEHGKDMGDAGGNCALGKFSGDSIESISFASRNSRENELSSTRHLNSSWSLFKYIEAGVSNKNFPNHIQNPNKAIATINARTSEILTANSVARYLFGLEDDGESKKLSDFILSPEDQYLFFEADLQPNGEVVLFSGRVMDLVTNTKEIIPVSIWARQIPADDDLRCLVVMEAVERVTGVVQFDFLGTILHCDSSFASVYGYHNPKGVVGLNIKDLIPSIEFDPENNDGDFIPKEGLKQCTTGRTRDGVHFPLNIKIHTCSGSCENKRNRTSSEPTQSSVTLYEGTVWVFNNVSGLITLSPDLTIHSCNTNFSMILFGYSQDELVGKNIAVLIPTFYEDVEFLDTGSIALPPFDEEEDSNAPRCGTSEGGRTDSAIDPPRPCNPMSKPMEFADDELHNLSPSTGSSNFQLPSPTKILESSYSNVAFPSSSKEAAENNEDFSLSCGTSSHKQLSCSESQDTLHSGTNSISDANGNVFADIGVPEDAHDSGDFCGTADGYACDSFESSESEEYSEVEGDSDSDGEGENCTSPRKMKVEMDRSQENKSPHNDCISGSRSFSIKISTPKDQIYQGDQSDQSFQSLPEGGFAGIGRHRDGTNLAIEYFIKKVALQDGKYLYCLWVSRDPDEVNVCTPLTKSAHREVYSEASDYSLSKSEASKASEDSLLPDAVYVDGIYSQNYTILQHIGKGAFGCIKKAYRNSDGLLVITKFIRKSEVYKDSWVYDKVFEKKVPLEISLLTTINHPNIVKVLDVYENEQCFQMVMEKHGSGMDLFEFIERDPKMDEPLTSYLFRQMVSALQYLHNLNIVHRDLKDENVIINHRFHVKLIDFGSAAFMGEKLFSTFCGTMEYCSPEVIEGNKYKGPELEMFALGVTLYTLVFGENPFVGADEILLGKVVVSRRISNELNSLIHHLLERDPLQRCTLDEVVHNVWVNQSMCIDDYSFSDVISTSEEEVNPSEYVDLTESISEATEIESKFAEVGLNTHKTSSESEIESLT